MLVEQNYNTIFVAVLSKQLCIECSLALIEVTPLLNELLDGISGAQNIIHVHVKSCLCLIMNKFCTYNMSKLTMYFLAYHF